MDEAAALIADRADVERWERRPLSDYYTHSSTHEMLRRAAEEYGERDALVFVPNGRADEPPFVYSHAALFARVTQAANLFHRLGIRPGRAVAYVLPSLPQAHFTLWGGEAPGIAKQSDLFTDPLGHPRGHIQALATYCHFAVIYGRNPKGLPAPAVIARLPEGEALNRLLQQLAWDAVTAHPLSGVKATAAASSR